MVSIDKPRTIRSLSSTIRIKIKTEINIHLCAFIVKRQFENAEHKENPFLKDLFNKRKFI